MFNLQLSIFRKVTHEIIIIIIGVAKGFQSLAAIVHIRIFISLGSPHEIVERLFHTLIERHLVDDLPTLKHTKQIGCFLEIAGHTAVGMQFGVVAEMIPELLTIFSPQRCQ